MLLQSYDDVITILPALPTAWANGSVTGLKAQGDYTVDEEWANNTPTRVAVTNNKSEDRNVDIRVAGVVKNFCIKGGETLVIELEDGQIPTSIQTINQGTVTEKAMYDLSGRRVSKLQQGVYIVDGKKMIF